MSDPTSRDLLRILTEAISRRCDLFGWKYDVAPDLVNLLGLSAHDGQQTGGRDAFPAPPVRQALRIALPRYTLLLACVESNGDVADIVPALTWAGLVRARLPGPSRADLHLYLIASRGAAAGPAWKRNRTTVENDERFCRKLLWLPPEDLTVAPQSAEKFLERTVFSALWAEIAPQEPRSLDPLLRLSDDLDNAAIGMERQEIAAWLSTLSTSVRSAGELAEAMVVALEREAADD